MSSAGGRTRGGATAAPLYPHPLGPATAELFEPLLGRPAAGTRGWPPLCLCVSAVVVAWGAARSLAERLAGACGTLADLYPGVACGATYQGWVKALGRLGRGRDGLHRRVADHLRGHVLALGGGRWRDRHGWCAFAVDGTRVDAPRTRANARGLGRAGRRGTGPQLTLTVVYHVGTGLPWAWQVGRGTASERAHLRRLVRTLPCGSLLVADAGFCGYDLWRDLRRRGVHWLVRVGSNVRLIAGLGCAARREGGQTAYVWPGDRRGEPPLPVRVVGARRARRDRRGGAGATAWLATDLPAGALSDAAAGALYTTRWGVEVFFRTFKQTLARRKLCSGTPAHARLELHWAVIGLAAANLLAARAIADRGHDPLSWSAALALRELRRAAGGRGGGDAAGLPARLAACRKDRYRRAGGKAARRWPHKKTDRPPGEPKVRYATPAEIQLASEVYDDELAA
ncbi:MAG TPA: transposase [Tepidisphaeraceae bacterium]|nr:transposase [Tepidisphaeraceae bacterium]